MFAYAAGLQTHPFQRTQETQWADLRTMSGQTRSMMWPSSTSFESVGVAWMRSGVGTQRLSRRGTDCGPETGEPLFSVRRLYICGQRDEADEYGLRSRGQSTSSPRTLAADYIDEAADA